MLLLLFFGVGVWSGCSRHEDSETTNDFQSEQDGNHSVETVNAGGNADSEPADSGVSRVNVPPEPLVDLPSSDSDDVQQDPGSSGPSFDSNEAEEKAPATDSMIQPAENIPVPTEDARNLVDRLTLVEIDADGLSPEQAIQWKNDLQRLIEQGASGVSAIQEFLQTYEDIEFSQDGWSVMGYPTVRAAMIDALGTIGGPEALAVSLETIETTADPREIALLAKTIEGVVPEEHRSTILEAARTSLAMSAEGQLEDRDVGPLFEVFEHYGGKEVIKDLEAAASRWNYYATAALAQLPEEMGVPALIRMVTESPNPSIPALDALASVSVRSTQAREALLELVGADRIRPNVWPYLARALIGDQVEVADSVFTDVWDRSTGQNIQTTHIRYGNQNFFRMPTLDSLTQEQLLDQLTLVDDCLLMAGSDPSAAQALERTKSILNRRLDEALLNQDGSGPSLEGP
jgi:hypothetical protein